MPLAFVLSGSSTMSFNFDGMEAALKTAYGPDTLALKVAVGGSSIIQWQRGHGVYDNAVALTKLAVLDGYTIGALLDFQGQKDAHSIYEANRWEALKLQHFDHFAEDVGYPDLPIVYAQLGTTPIPDTNFPGWGTIKAAAADIKVQRPQYKMVTTINAGPYLVEDDGTIGPHYANYSTITSRFVNNTKLLVPVP